MMSNKRGSEDISGEIEPQQSPNSAPKRSKLDFLAMIAEMSEKSDEEAKASEASVEESSSNSDSPFKTSAPPKSSFAAWKLAKGKGRKNGSKSPNRKDSSGSEAEARPKGKATGEALHNPLLAVLAAATPLPVKDVSQTASVPPKKKTSKKVTSPKKAGAAIKKESTSPKKANKKKGDASGKTNGSGKSKSKKGDNSGLKTSSFPEKIMELLLGGLAPNAIYWLPEGEAIAVDPDNFKDSTIISKHFRGNKLSSFVRSLNRWGFRRIFYHSLPDKTLAFYHRLFQKQAPALVKEMKMDGGEKEPELPPGAMAAVVTADGKLVAKPTVQNPESPASTQPMVVPATKAELPALAQSNQSPGLATSGLSEAAVLQAAIDAANKATSAPAILPQEPVLSAPVAAVSEASLAQNLLDRSALERSALEQLAESQHALQLQQAMAAEQERSDVALHSLQAQQMVLQSLAEQQNAAQAEELLMQSMLAEQQRSGLALHQRQSEQALLQQMLAEQEQAALMAALGGAGAGVGGLSTEALLRERLLIQQLNAGAFAPAPSSEVLALLQQQLQTQQQVREPSYMEQLLLLEQQQQQRHQEAALLAAHGFHFG